MDGVTPPQPPKQIADHDLTTSKNGEARKANAPSLGSTNAEYRHPADIMRALGFCPTKHMNPLQFLLAVMNDDLDLVFKRETKRAQAEARGGIGLEYRIECAKSAVKYIHMEMPKVSITDDVGNFGESLRNASSAGLERVHRKTMIIEEIERISPDVPLAAANYPPHLGLGDKPVIMNEAGIIEGEDLNPDGDQNYNPDVDDAG